MSPQPSLKELPPIEADELNVWLSMTGTAKNWPTKARVVALIGSHVGGDWWTAEMVAKPLGLTVPYVSRLLRGLATDRVLWRDGGVGSRLYWVEVNPRIGDWRNVDWTLSRHERQGVLAMWRQSTDSTPAGRFFARSCSARRENAIARYKSARTGDQKDTTSRALGARDPEGGPQGGSRALQSRGGGEVVDLQKRRGFDGAPQEVLSTGDGACESPPSEPAGAAAGADPFVVDAVVGEIKRRAKPAPGRGRFFAESQRVLVAQLVARYGEAVTLAAVDQVPDEGQMVPSFITDLAEQLALGAFAQRPTERDVAAQRSRLLERRHRCAERLATYQELGEDELAEICRGELEACDTELAALEAPREEAL